MVSVIATVEVSAVVIPPIRIADVIKPIRIQITANVREMTVFGTISPYLKETDRNSMMKVLGRRVSKISTK